MDPTARPWAFVDRMRGAPDVQAASADVSVVPRPGELSLGLHRAVGELRRAARREPARAADGAVLLCELLAPMLEPVDDPLGTLAAAAIRTIDALAPIVAAAEVVARQREAWLERLWAALLRDESGHLRRLAEHWGALCGEPGRAQQWALRLAGDVESVEGVGTAAAIACLASQVAAGQHTQALALLATRPIAVWPERQFGVLALAALARVDEALVYAAASNPLGHRHAQDIARVCEAVLLAAGRRDEAYERFAATAHARQNCRQTFDALRRAYPERPASALLDDLIAASPGNEGRWFATACALRFHALAIEIARRSPCDPRTLLRHGTAALDADPALAGELALAAIRWMCAGHGVEIDGDDVYAAHDLAGAAALRTGTQTQLRATVMALCDRPHAAAQWVHGLLARELEG